MIGGRLATSRVISGITARHPDGTRDGSIPKITRDGAGICRFSACIHPSCLSLKVSGHRKVDAFPTHVYVRNIADSKGFTPLRACGAPPPVYSRVVVRIALPCRRTRERRADELAGERMGMSGLSVVMAFDRVPHFLPYAVPG